MARPGQEGPGGKRQGRELAWLATKGGGGGGEGTTVKRGAVQSKVITTVAQQGCGGIVVAMVAQFLGVGRCSGVNLAGHGGGGHGTTCCFLLGKWGWRGNVIF